MQRRYTIITLCLVPLLLLSSEVSAVPLLSEMSIQLRRPVRWSEALSLSHELSEGVWTLLARQVPPPVDLDEIHWTTWEEVNVDRLASGWGISLANLLELNPELEKDGSVPAGTRLCVFRYDPGEPTLSIGRPHSGSLRNGVPFPEAPFWDLRTDWTRRYQYGSRLMVETLVEGFLIYAREYPLNRQMLRVGDLSRRGGGAIRPHRSHKSGRDIDLGYIGLKDIGEKHWVDVTPRTVDAEKTWFLLKTLIDSGRVQVMFVDRRIQLRLNEIAAKTLSEGELATLFEYPRRDNSHRAIMQHWRGHDDHVHIRFQCADEDPRCRGSYAPVGEENE